MRLYDPFVGKWRHSPADARMPSHWERDCDDLRFPRCPDKPLLATIDMLVAVEVPDQA